MSFNGHLPTWAVRALVAVLVMILSIVGVWVSGIPAMGERITVLEEAHRELRDEIRAGFRDLTARIDRVYDRQKRGEK